MTVLHFVVAWTMCGFCIWVFVISLTKARWIGRDTSYGKIIEAVERAERSRAPKSPCVDIAADLIDD
jgi:hypothetical protein